MAKTLEDRLLEWQSQAPTCRVTNAERKFIADMRKAAECGVGYGWMQQAIEWEWQSKGEGAWGPEYFNQQIAELEKSKE
jgi:hypothetical protein